MSIYHQMMITTIDDESELQIGVLIIKYEAFA